MRRRPSIKHVTGAGTLIAVAIVCACAAPTAAVADAGLTDDEKTALRKQLATGADITVAPSEMYQQTMKSGAWYHRQRFVWTMNKTRIDPLTGRVPIGDQERLARHLVGGANAETAGKQFEEAAKGSRVLKWASRIGAANTLYETADDWGKSIAENGLASPKPYASLVGNASVVLVAAIPVVGPPAAILFSDQIEAFGAGVAEGASSAVAKGIDAYFEWKDERMMEQIAKQARASDYRATQPDPAPAPSMRAASPPASSSQGGSSSTQDSPSGAGDLGPTIQALDLLARGLSASAPRQAPARSVQAPPAAAPPGVSAPRSASPPAPRPAQRPPVAERPPAGWVPCTCPTKHTGKYYGGALYHPSGLKCPTK